METLPFLCPRLGSRLTLSHRTDDRFHYDGGYGGIILSTTVVDYLDPVIDRDGRRAKLVLELIAEAWAQQNMSPYINAVIFDRRLAEQEQKPAWWVRFFRSHTKAK